ncbi:MAG: AzlD domain-containing protein [Clostridia bacterium]|nr:AzlD domain-containing protein [Clostridia bacterium]MBP3652977.1 AzlD domain-containing protein [Clostridia bacterium]
MQANVYVYIAVMAIVTYLIRTLPLTLVRREIKNVYIRSFLYYVPYVTLSVMTFPSMMDATNSQWSGLAALVVGLVLAWRGASLFKVAVAACAVVYVLELFIV